MGKSNILILFTDDQRFKTFGGINNPEIITPNFDHLVQEGVFFNNAYIPGGTCGAVCMPSRAMLHTGRGLFSLENSGEAIPDEHVLLGEYLMENGYDTFGTGKWHNGIESYARSFKAGGDIFFGGMDDHWNVPVCEFKEDGKYPDPVEHPWNPGTGWIESIPKSFDHINKGFHSTDMFGARAVEYLKNRESDNPFFMYVAFMAPHDPRVMPKKFMDMYDPGKITLPPNFMQEHSFDNGELLVRDELLASKPRDPDEIRRHLAEYYAMITHLDFRIGEILDKLRETGEYENTIIILAGDNGLALGSHGLMGKQNLYDHSIHVPLTISGPGIGKNTVTDANCYLFDIFPTICDLVELPVPNTVEGKSMKNVLNGERDKGRDRIFFAYKDIQRAVQVKGLKLITYLVEEKFSYQLFNVNDDPWELEDLSISLKQDYSKDIQSLAAIMLEEMVNHKDENRDKWLADIKNLTA